jgi:hypothetical protein
MPRAYTGDKKKRSSAFPAWLKLLLGVAALGGGGYAFLSLEGSLEGSGSVVEQTGEGDQNEAPIIDDQDQGSLRGSGKALFHHIFTSKPLGLSLALSGRESPTIMVKGTKIKGPVRAGDLVIKVAGNDVQNLGLKELLAEINKHYLPLEITFKHSQGIAAPILGGGGGEELKEELKEEEKEAKKMGVTLETLHKLEQGKAADPEEAKEKIFAASADAAGEIRAAAEAAAKGTTAAPTKAGPPAKRYKHKKMKEELDSNRQFKHTFAKKHLGIKIHKSDKDIFAKVTKVEDLELTAVKAGDALLEVAGKDVSKLGLKALFKLIKEQETPFEVTFKRVPQEGGHDEE